MVTRRQRKKETAKTGGTAQQRPKNRIRPRGIPAIVAVAKFSDRFPQADGQPIGHYWQLRHAARMTDCFASRELRGKTISRGNTPVFWPMTSFATIANRGANSALPFGICQRTGAFPPSNRSRETCEETAPQRVRTVLPYEQKNLRS